MVTYSPYRININMHISGSTYPDDYLSGWAGTIYLRAGTIFMGWNYFQGLGLFFMTDWVWARTIFMGWVYFLWDGTIYL
jgi:hypothetical protein